MVVVAMNLEIGFVVVLALGLLAGGRFLPKPVTRRLWVTAAALSAWQYLQTRFGVVNWGAAWIAVPLLLAELLGLAHMLGFLFVQWSRRPSPERSITDAPALPLYVLVPTTNEGAAVLERTLRGVLAAVGALRSQRPDIPVTVTICNDGYVTGYPGWRDSERLAARLDVRCLTRGTGGGAKAGNLQHAWDHYEIPDDALVAVFDADQTPTPDFFLRTLPPFADDDVGWVQTGQYYRNTDNLIANWADQQMLLFYDNLCPYKAGANALFLCGTNFVVRGRALNEIGGLPTESPTEDFAASLPMHINGWRGVYLTERLADGLGPMDMKSYLRQQSRWARGCLMVTGQYWRQLMLPWVRGLTLLQRLHYLLSGTHYLGGLRDLTFVIVPIVFLLLGVSAVETETPVYIISFAVYWSVGMAAAAWHMAEGVSIWRVNMMAFGCFPILVRSFQRVLVQDEQPFDVTSKRRLLQGSRTMLAPHGAFLAVIVVSLWVGWGFHNASVTDVAVNSFWLVYSGANLIGFMALGLLSDRRAADSESRR